MHEARARFLGYRLADQEILELRLQVDELEARIASPGYPDSLLREKFLQPVRRELDRRGIRRSLPSLLEELGEIREVCVVYPAAAPGEEPTLEMTLTELSEEQQALYQALNLGRYRTA